MHIGTLLRSLGREVQARRVARALTQEELAHRAGVSSGALKCVERGRNFTIKTIFAIASTVDTPLGELLTMAENRALSEQQKRLSK